MRGIRVKSPVAVVAAGVALMALTVVADEAFDLPLLPFGGAGTPMNWTEVAVEVALILLAGIVVVFLVGRLESERRRMEEMVEQRTAELKDAQEELVRKEKLAILGQLAGGVSHELRNPLGVISNAAYFLQMTLSEADSITREYLEMIGSEVRKAEKIVSDLLGFSRVRPAERQEVAVADLVEQVLEKQPPPEGVKVDAEIATGLAPVFVDPAQMGQVLANLVSNACQAMPEGGKLSIRARGKKGAVHLCVADTGCGISKENLGKISEPLFTTRARGIGLGLAVSRSLVEANGGNIEVKSEEGKGSTFTVILPAGDVAS